MNSHKTVKKNFYSYSPKEILPVYPGAAELYKTTTMAEGEPLRKKQKKVEDDIFHIFHTFHDKYCADDMSILHTAYKTLFQKESSLITYSIRFCNAHQPVEFTDAYLDLEEHIDVIYPIGGIFESGLSVLRNFLMSKEIPEDRNIQRILSTLLTYLLDQGISWFTGLPPYSPFLHYWLVSSLEIIKIGNTGNQNHPDLEVRVVLVTCFSTIDY